MEGLEGISSEGMDSEGYDGEGLDFFTDPNAKGTTKKPNQELKKAPVKKPQAPVQKTEAVDDDATEQKQHRLKVDGEEIEVDDEELDIKTKQDAEQLKRASYKRMQEAAAMKKEYESGLSQIKQMQQQFGQYEKSHQTLLNFVEQMKSNPAVIFDIAKQFNADVDKMAEDRLYSRWEHANLSPEQKELLELRREKSEREANDKKLAERQAAQDRERAKSEYAGSLKQQYEELYKELGGRTDPVTTWLMLAMMDLNGKQGKLLSVKDAHQMVQALQPQYRTKWLQNLSDVDFNSLPEEFVSRVRKHDVAKFRSEAVPGRRVPGANPSTEQDSTTQTKKPFVLNDDFFIEMDRKRRS